MPKTTTKKKYRLFIPVIVLAVILFGFIGIRSGALKFSFTASKNTQPKDFKIPSTSITPPPGWQKLNPNTSKGEKYRFESNQIDEEEVSGGSITTNAVISIKIAGTYQNLDNFVSQYKSSGTKTKGYQVLDSGTLDNNGYRLETKYDTKVGGGTITVHELDYLFFKDGVSFLLTGYSSDSAWDKHEREIKTSLDSFKFN